MSKPLTLDDVCVGLDLPENVRTFADTPGTRVVFGPGTLAQLGSLANPLGKRAMIVTDPGIFRAGYTKQATLALEAVGIDVTVFHEVHENPTTLDVAAAVALAKAENIDLLIGLGGGSSMDCAKGCNFILTNGGEMRDYWGKEKATKPMLPLIAIPTTAGTGSECQSFALIADAETHHKMACGDKKAAAKIAILDPALTVSQPARVTALTGIDAMTHAVESLVSTASTPLSRSYSLAGFALISRGLEAVVKDPLNILERARMQVGAAFAGTAIENSMLGAAHSAANPLTAHFNIVHGQAVGVMLPAVVRWNAKNDPRSKAAYDDLFPQGQLDQWIEDRLRDFGLEIQLKALGVTRESLPTLAEEAAKQWTAGFNPVTPTVDDFLSLYEQVF